MILSKKIFFRLSLTSICGSVPTILYLAIPKPKSMLQILQSQNLKPLNFDDNSQDSEWDTLLSHASYDNFAKNLSRDQLKNKCKKFLTSNSNNKGNYGDVLRWCFPYGRIAKVLKEFGVEARNDNEWGTFKQYYGNVPEIQSWGQYLENNCKNAYAATESISHMFNNSVKFFVDFCVDKDAKSKIPKLFLSENEVTKKGNLHLIETSFGSYISTSSELKSTPTINDILTSEKFEIISSVDDYSELLTKEGTYDTTNYVKVSGQKILTKEELKDKCEKDLVKNITNQSEFDHVSVWCVKSQTLGDRLKRFDINLRSESEWSKFMNKYSNFAKSQELVNYLKEECKKLSSTKSTSLLYQQKKKLFLDYCVDKSSDNFDVVRQRTEKRLLGSK